MNDLGDHLKKCLKRSGHTLDSFSQATGTCKSTIHGWIVGARTPGIANCRIVASALGLSLVEFLDGVFDAPLLSVSVPAHSSCSACGRTMYKSKKQDDPYADSDPWAYCRRNGCRLKGVFVTGDRGDMRARGL